MDLNRDRRLCVREIRNAGLLAFRRGTATETATFVLMRFPHHFEMSIGRGKITGVGVPAIAARMESTPAAPGDADWSQVVFRKWIATVTETSPAASSSARALISSGSTATTTD